MEVGATEQEHAEKIIKQVLSRSSDQSIFKNKMIEMYFEQEVKDSYGDIERHERVYPVFLKTPPVTDDDIIFILTTNAIDRVEAAIRERPGRISQCVSFTAPSAELRRLYLESLLAPYDCLHSNMDELIPKTEGVTQAFLKELV